MRENNKTPDYLYHYTSVSGLLGIIETSTLWASSIHYLNDSKEFQQAFESALRVFHSLKSEINNNLYRKLDRKLSEQFDRISSVNILVASLSEDGDSLSQWRGYCEPGAGYAIGLEKSKLIKLAKEQNYRLTPCKYRYEDHREIISPLIKSLVAEEMENIEDVLDSFLDKFVKIAPIIKNKSFEDEKEWRLISDIIPINHPDWNIRVGHKMLIPYSIFNLGKGADSAIEQINIGPTPHMNLAVESVGDALNKAGIKYWGVTPSQSSFRDW